VSVLALASVLALGAGPALGETPAATRAVPPDRAAATAVVLPPLERAVRIFDATAARQLTPRALIDELALAEVVFLGETHLDETTHRFEARVLEALAERTGDRVVLALEMFERDVQPVLDRYLVGEISEAQMRAQARPWNNYPTAYRPLIELARRHGVPVVASNVPRPLLRKIAMGGAEAYRTLPPEDARWLPRELLANSERYWRRAAGAVRGHAGQRADESAEALLYSTQSLWDNSMGEACADALAEHPGFLVVHVNGGFHSAYGDGTVHQLLARRPGTRVKTVAIWPVADLNGAAATLPSSLRGPPVADYLVLAEARAHDLDQGTFGVALEAELRYRLEVPASASDAAPVPLLIWLAAEGQRAQDAERLLTSSLGTQVATAVVEPPYPQTERDLYQAGRWFWPGRLREDTDRLTGGLEKVLAQVLRNAPVRSDRIVLAGEGAGATVVAAAMLGSKNLPARGLAIRPARNAKLRELGLPGDDLANPPRTLRVLSTPEQTSWWRQEAASLAVAGLRVTVDEEPDGSWLVAQQALRRALGLAPSPPANDARPRTILLLAHDTPRARLWARLEARARTTAGERVTIARPETLAAAIDAGVKPAAIDMASRVTIQPLWFLGEEVPAGLPDTLLATLPDGVEMGAVVRPQALADVRGLPVAPGPFGGSTVVVSLPGAGAQARAAWKALADADVIKQQHRFARLFIAELDGNPSLPEQLDQLRDQGRSNVLIVPAVYAADARTMQQLERIARGHTRGMTIHWLPGLGGELYRRSLPSTASPPAQ